MTWSFFGMNCGEPFADLAGLGRPMRAAAVRMLDDENITDIPSHEGFAFLQEPGCQHAAEILTV